MYLKAYLAEYYWNPRTKTLPEKTILHNAEIILFTIYQCIYFIGISEKTRIDLTIRALQKWRQLLPTNIY